MNARALLLPTLALATLLASCGKGGSIQKDIGKTEADRKSIQAARETPKYKLTQEAFRNHCLDLGGRLDSLGETCLTSVVKQIQPESPAADLVIDPNFPLGAFLRVRGEANAPVDILLNGKHLLGIPGEYLNHTHSGTSGKLAFQVY